MLEMHDIRRGSTDETVPQTEWLFDASVPWAEGLVMVEIF